MAKIPPTKNPRAYATPLLLAWQTELEQRMEYGRNPPSFLLKAIRTELARRQAAAIPEKK